MSDNDWKKRRANKSTKKRSPTRGSHKEKEVERTKKFCLTLKSYSFARLQAMKHRLESAISQDDEQIRTWQEQSIAINQRINALEQALQPIKAEHDEQLRALWAHRAQIDMHNMLLSRKIDELRAKLSTGFFSSFFASNNASITAQIEELQSKRLEYVEQKPRSVSDFPESVELAALKKQLRSVEYNIGLTKVRLFEQRKELNLVEQERLAKINQEEIDKHKRAKVAAADGNTRKLAARLRKQLERPEFCPYCSNPLLDELRLDHITPVAMGGLSVPYNLVFVCNLCNQRKSDKTLREFCEKYSLDRSKIEAALIALGKRV